MPRTNRAPVGIIGEEIILTAAKNLVVVDETLGDQRDFLRGNDRAVPVVAGERLQRIQILPERGNCELRHHGIEGLPDIVAEHPLGGLYHRD